MTASKGLRRVTVAVGVLIALLAVGIAVTFALRQRSSHEKPTIRLHDGQWGSMHLNNAVAKFIIEKGYDYPVETVAETSYVMQLAMENGTIDVNLEARRHNWINWYNEQVRAGNILSVGVIFEGGSQFFVISRWVAEKHNIKTVFDMREAWQLFQDPESPTKGRFYNGTIGWGCNTINEVKLEAYRLNKYYNIFSPGSATEWDAAMSRAQACGQPVFGYCWSPNSLMGAHDWYILQEPEYDKETWLQVMAASDDASLRPLDQACAYEVVAIEKIIHRGLLKKAPDVVEMLKQMNIGLRPLNEVLAWKRKNRVRSWRISSLYYLRRNEERWKEWVTPEAFDKIKAALAMAPGSEPRSKQ